MRLPSALPAELGTKAQEVAALHEAQRSAQSQMAMYIADLQVACGCGCLCVCRAAWLLLLGRCFPRGGTRGALLWVPCIDRPPARLPAGLRAPAGGDAARDAARRRGGRRAGPRAPGAAGAAAGGRAGGLWCTLGGRGPLLLCCSDPVLRARSFLLPLPLCLPQVRFQLERSQEGLQRQLLHAEGGVAVLEARLADAHAGGHCGVAQGWPWAAVRCLISLWPARRLAVAAAAAAPPLLPPSYTCKHPCLFRRRWRGPEAAHRAGAGAGGGTGGAAGHCASRPGGWAACTMAAVAGLFGRLPLGGGPQHRPAAPPTPLQAAPPRRSSSGTPRPARAAPTARRRRCRSSAAC